jgi:hypothetical protein
MINPPLERLKQALHELTDVFVPAGLIRADDVRAVVMEARRLSVRVKELERTLVAEVALREAARRNLEQASLSLSLRQRGEGRGEGLFRSAPHPAFGRPLTAGRSSEPPPRP